MCLKRGLFKIEYNPYNNSNQPFKNENIIYVVMGKGLSNLTLDKQSSRTVCVLHDPGGDGGR